MEREFDPATDRQVLGDLCKYDIAIVASVSATTTHLLRGMFEHAMKGDRTRANQIVLGMIRDRLEGDESEGMTTKRLSDIGVKRGGFPRRLCTAISRAWRGTL